MTDFNWSRTRWEVETSRSLPKALSVQRLQEAWNALDGLLAAAGLAELDVDWSVEETVMATRSITPDELNRFETGFVEASTAINSKLDIMTAQSTYKDEGEIQALIDAGGFQNEQQVEDLIAIGVAPFKNEQEIAAIAQALVDNARLNQGGGTMIDVTDFLRRDGTLTLTGNLLPDSGNSSDLGSTGSYYRDIFGGTVHVGVITHRAANTIMQIGTLNEDVAPIGNWNFVGATPSNIPYSALTGAPDLTGYVETTDFAAWNTSIVLASGATVSVATSGDPLANIHTNQINGRPIAEYLTTGGGGSSVDVSALGTGVVLGWTDEDDGDIGSAFTVTAGTGKARDLAVVQPGTSKRPDNIWTKFLIAQVIEGATYSNNETRIEFEATEIKFSTHGLDPSVEVDWTNTVHINDPFMRANVTTLDSVTSVGGVAITDIYTSSTARLGDTTTITHINNRAISDYLGGGGTTISATWQDLPSAIPATFYPVSEDGSQNWGRSGNPFGEIHGLDIFGGEFGGSGTSTVYFGFAQNATKIRGATLEFILTGGFTGNLIPNTDDVDFGSNQNKLANLHVVAAHIDELRATTLYSTLLPRTDADVSLGGTGTNQRIHQVNAETLNTEALVVSGSIQQGATTYSLANFFNRNVSLIPGATDVDLGDASNEFRNGYMSGTLQFGTGGIRGTSNTTVGQDSATGRIGSGHFLSLRSRNLQADGENVLTLAGKVDFGNGTSTIQLRDNLALINTPNFGLSSAPGGTAWFNNFIIPTGNADNARIEADFIVPRTDSGTPTGTVGAAGRGYADVYSEDIHTDNLVPRDTNDRTIKVGMTTNHSHLAAAGVGMNSGSDYVTTIQGQGWAWQDQFESNQNAAQRAHLGVLSPAAGTSYRPWKYGVSLHYVITGETDRIHATDLDDTANHPAGSLYVAWVRSDKQRGSTLDRFELELGENNDITSVIANARQYLRGGWLLEQDGDRLIVGTASTEAQIHFNAGGQISGAVAFDENTTVDWANTSHTNVPAEFTGGGGGGGFTTWVGAPDINAHIGIATDGTYNIGTGPDNALNRVHGRHFLGPANVEFGVEDVSGVQQTAVLHGHMRPSTTSHYDLGINDHRWRNVYGDAYHGTTINLTGTSARLTAPAATITDIVGTNAGFADLTVHEIYANTQNENDTDWDLVIRRDSEATAGKTIIQAAPGEEAVIDQSRIFRANTRIKIFEHTGAIVGNVTTTYTVGTETKTVAEISAMTGAQAVHMKVGTASSETTGGFWWDGKTIWLDEDDNGNANWATFAGMHFRSVPDLSAPGALAYSALDGGNFELVWGYQNQMLRVPHGTFGAGNKLEIWVIF